MPSPTTKDTPLEAANEHLTHARYKSRMKWRVFASLSGVAFFFFFALFPQDAFRELHGSFSHTFAVLAKLVGTLSVASIASWALFASDSAFRGTNRTSKWIRSIYPSISAKTKFQCGGRDATALWFRYFDTWGIANSPNHGLMGITYSATYAARLVYYLIRTLAVTSLLGVGAIVVNWFVLDSYGGPAGNGRLVLHGFVLSTLIASMLIIIRANRIRSDKRPSIGCWQRLEQVFASSRTMFERDVLAKASTLSQAFDRVDAIREQLERKTPRKPSSAPHV